MDLLKCNGRRFLAKIRGVKCEGKVCVERGKVYLCQNEQDGKLPNNTFGYKYGWVVADGSMGELRHSGVFDFTLIPTTKEEAESYYDWQVGDIVKGGVMPKVNDPSDGFEFVEGRYIIAARINDIVFINRLDMELAAGPYTCQQLYDMGCRLVLDEPKDDTVELTIDEIAKKFEVDPS